MLRERFVLVSVVSEEMPTVPEKERVAVRELGAGFFQVVARYGFDARRSGDAGVDRDDVVGPKLQLRTMETTYFLGRETVLPTGRGRMARWRKQLFIVVSRSPRTASASFGLPPNRVVELGAQIQM